MTIIRPPEDPPPRKRRVRFHDDGITRNQLFNRFIMICFIILLLTGAGMTAIAFFGSSQLALRMINVFSAAFGTFIGFGSGYLLGSGKDNGN